MVYTESSSGNVYADLGHTDADTMQAKAQVAASMHRIIESLQLSPDGAARLAGIPEDELKAILAGQFSSHSLSTLERMQKEIQQCTET